MTATARDAAGNTSDGRPDGHVQRDGHDGASRDDHEPDDGSDVHGVRRRRCTVAGTASDNVGVTQVSWVNNRGGSGTATGTTSWNASIALQSGSNVVTVTARDAAGNTSTDVLDGHLHRRGYDGARAVHHEPDDRGDVDDDRQHADLRGTATDNVGVTQVNWANNRGWDGTASGTTSWSTSNVQLWTGINVVTVTARDAAGNVATRVLTVTKQ